ncbi:hypothetical protein B5M42_020880 [Paenibacillus athensensis]|uniref:PIN domain-containing protein n=1 Tax=Paenibacillus athensensis TaxID=1967502 RepID=A0A4Y8Q129_9BACL|nr:hypothetical protein [Paenibacillus athensensis]MCD1261259.1 hypothetical protein [Paenibacillus athensensis]
MNKNYDLLSNDINELNENLTFINDINSGVKYRIFAVYILDLLNENPKELENFPSFHDLINLYKDYKLTWLESVSVLQRLSKVHFCEFAAELNKDLSLLLEEMIAKEASEINKLKAIDRELILFIYKYYKEFFSKKICYSCKHCLDFSLYLDLISNLINERISIEAVEEKLHYHKIIQIQDSILELIAKKKNDNVFRIERTFIRNTKPIVYFDQNVLVKYEEDADFKLLVNKSKIDFYYAYSPSHLEEINKRSDQDKKEHILNEIIDLTEKLIILPWDDGLKLFYEDPKTGLKRVFEHRGEAAALVEKLRLLKYEGRTILHKKYLEYSKSINNMDLFEKDKDLLEGVLKQLSSGFTLDSIKNLANPESNYIRINNIIYKLYNAFDVLGFWKEKNSDLRAIKSSVHDIEHLIYAICADIFVTSDEKCFKRSQAIFSHIKPALKVLSLNQFISKLNGEH